MLLSNATCCKLQDAWDTFCCCSWNLMYTFNPQHHSTDPLMQLWCNLKPPWSWGVREPSLGGDSLWIFGRASPDWQWELEFLPEKSIVIVVDFVWNCTKKHSNLFNIRVGKNRCSSIYRLIFIFIFHAIQICPTWKKHGPYVLAFLGPKQTYLFVGSAIHFRARGLV